MKVTPVKKNFGSHKVGDAFELKDRSAKLLIRIGRLAHVPSSPNVPLTTERTSTELMEERKAATVYETRAFTADAPKESRSAPAKRPYRRRDMRPEE